MQLSFLVFHAHFGRHSDPARWLQVDFSDSLKQLGHCSRSTYPLTVQQIDFDFGDHVDKNTFAQILDMDEDEDKDFSKGIVFGFLEQAETTFAKMDAEK